MKTIADALEDVRKQLEHHESQTVRLRAIQEFLESEVAKEQKPASTQVERNGHFDVRMTQAEAAEKVLGELGHAAKISEIARIAIERGLIVSDATEKDIRNTLYGSLLKNKKFKRTAPGTFDLADREASKTA
jgi:HB1, ASXL, restriction endonuclease HTH domain